MALVTPIEYESASPAVRAVYDDIRATRNTDISHSVARPPHRTRVPASASQCSGVPNSGSGASASEIVTPCGQSGGQIAT